MSLPNYLAKIKSAGMYRFTFDKSQLPAAQAETMRLVIGYSEKGPFNNPVYIDKKQDFINLFGNINKRLEKKGVFFHRMALQALSGGPILALNLKPFNGGGEAGTSEQVNYASFNPCEVVNQNALTLQNMDVLTLFDRDRFWKVEADQLPKKISFVTTEELEKMYPEMSPRDREYQIVKKKKAVFLMHIGAPLSNGEPHDTRAADYDDWKLNGDLLVYSKLLDTVIELSSMGIRVDANSINEQLTSRGLESELENNPYVKAVMNNELPLSIGGGIGQSRICMFLLQKAHIGEVQASVWKQEEVDLLAANNIHLL